MNKGDYITNHTVRKLSTKEYKKFRSYLKLLGHNIDPEFGKLFNTAYNEPFRKSYENPSEKDFDNAFLLLDADDDLSWWDVSYFGHVSGKEITYNEIIKMINLAPV